MPGVEDPVGPVDPKLAPEDDRPRKAAAPPPAAATEKIEKDGYQPVMMSFKAFLETQVEYLSSYWV